jgi:hypothetical protein
MIPKLFERSKIIIDYLFQAEQDLDEILLSNQNSSIPTDLSLDLMSSALRCHEIILNNSGDIFRTHLPLKEFGSSNRTFLHNLDHCNQRTAGVKKRLNKDRTRTREESRGESTGAENDG